jgi:hypothetical protein
MTAADGTDLLLEGDEAAVWVGDLRDELVDCCPFCRLGESGDGEDE